MSLTNWRQFQFFSAIPIPDPYFGSDRALYSDPTISGIAAAGDYIAIVSDNAMVKLISSKFEHLAEWRVEDAGWTVSRLHWVNPSSNGQKGILVTISERQGQSISLKLWDLDKLTSPNYNWMKFDHNSSFKSHCSISNAQGGNNYPLTCYDAFDDYSMLAFGFSNGSVILVSGDLLHDRGTRQRVIYKSNEPITNLKFRDDMLLYCTTLNKIFTIETSGKNQGRIEKMLDDKRGAELYSADTITRNSSKELIIIRDDIIQYYNSRGKSHSIVLEIPKQKIHVYKNRYVLFSSPLEDELIKASSFKIIIIDLINKFVVFNQTVKNSISDIFEVWGDMYILTGDGVLTKFHELSSHEKVDAVIKRELFPIAIKIATEDSKTFNENEILQYYKLYGDNLYEKEDYNESIQQYMKCIALKKTSEVIAKFKDSSKIPYLINYLEKMIELKVSNVDHVTLLLGCYCKLKQHEKILNYINNLSVDSDYDIIEKHKRFDLDAIILLCKDNGNFKLASLISQKFNLPDKVVLIQLKNLKNPKLAMSYIQTLKIDDLLRILVEYSDKLLQLLPNDMTKLLIDVFTGNYVSLPSLDDDKIAEPNSNPKSDDEESPLLTSYKQFVQFMKLPTSKSPSVDEEIETPSAPSYLPPKPKIIFSSFAKHNYEFVIFLEACIDSYEKYDAKTQDKKELVITLYEMYLTLKASRPEDKEWQSQWEQKATELISAKQQWTLEEVDKLLMISNLYNFSRGEMIITSHTSKDIPGYELGLFRSLTLSSEWDESWKIVKEFGAKMPELYTLALESYTASDSVLGEVGPDKLNELLEIIEKNDYMTTIEVVDTLCHSGAKINLGILKPLIKRSVQRQKGEIEKANRLYDAYSAKITELESKISKMQDESTIVNTGGGNLQGGCEVCKGPVEFPMIFFRCGHQAHESCLIEDGKGGNSGCPRCADSQEAAETAQAELTEQTLRSRAVLQRLGPTGRFREMMAFLGRGGFSSGAQERIVS